MYDEFIEGKRVVLVAPGAQTEIMKLGKEIDSYDIVARVGHYNVLVPDEIGSRTDVVCENFWFWTDDYKIEKQKQFDEWLNQGVKYINYVWVNGAGLDEFKRMNQGRIPIRLQPDHHVRAVRSAVDSPTKGFCAIFDYMAAPIKELFLVGFTCKRGFGYRRDYFRNPFNMPTPGQEYKDPSESVHDLTKWTEDIRGHSHRPDQELDYLKRLLTNKKVRFDPWAEKVLCV